MGSVISRQKCYRCKMSKINSINFGELTERLNVVFLKGKVSGKYNFYIPEDPQFAKETLIHYGDSDFFNFDFYGTDVFQDTTISFQKVNLCTVCVSKVSLDDDKKYCPGFYYRRSYNVWGNSSYTRMLKGVIKYLMDSQIEFFNKKIKETTKELMLSTHNDKHVSNIINAYVFPQ
jgi:hypothetical protein